MSGSGRSLLFLLRRCVTGRQTRLSSGIQAGGSWSSHRCCHLLQQQTRTPACRQRSFQPLSVLKLNHVGLCTKAGAPWEEEYPPLPAYQSEPDKKEVYIVQVKGLPWSCSAEDLLNFFSDCRIRDGVNGIHMTTDRMGRRSGRAFLEMEHEEDVGKALEKHRQYLGPRYVEVFEVTNRDAEAILKKAIPTPADDGVVRLRGLPFSSTEADIIEFFSGLDIVENGVTIITDRQGRNSGDAFVQFSSPEAATKALQRDRDVMGHRYIEVFPSRSDEVHSRRTRSSGSLQSSDQPAPRRTPAQSSTTSRSPQSSTVQLHYVHMRGIPFNAAGDDIIEILLECGSNGRLTGEADVFFTCHQDAVAAMSKDRKHIGDRYIELFLNSADPDQR
ncbi:G-rich sequence factor 1 isoform X2 [Nelusetta ayraudi]|uniref:G-rich sequence factor 1 isoform X2 n=1 Tax=Nelusetta ayraudi TaxID=303726 RepID=UPI003F723D8B